MPLRTRSILSALLFLAVAGEFARGQNMNVTGQVQPSSLISATSVTATNFNNLKVLGVFPAAGCNNATAGTGLDLPTTNAPTPNCYGSTIRFGALDFTNAGTQNAFFHFTLPADWASSQPVNINLTWFSTATTSTTKWAGATFCAVPGTSVLTGTLTLNTAVTTTTNNPTTAATTASSALASLAATGCAAGYEMWVQVKRTDTNTGTSSLLSATATVSRTF